MLTNSAIMIPIKVSIILSKAYRKGGFSLTPITIARNTILDMTDASLLLKRLHKYITIRMPNPPITDWVVNNAKLFLKVKTPNPLYLQEVCL